MSPYSTLSLRSPSKNLLIIKHYFDRFICKCMILAIKPCKNASAMKHLIGLCIKGICSANIKISRGRRELTSRYVHLDWSEALYAVNPTHASIFGGTSLDEAIKAAKEVSKSEKKQLELDTQRAEKFNGDKAILEACIASFGSPAETVTRLINERISFLNMRT